MVQDFKSTLLTKEKVVITAFVKKISLVYLLLFLVVLLFFSYFDVEIKLRQKKDVLPQNTALNDKSAVNKPEPKFAFYTILENTEFVVPSYEINISTREEKIGKGIQVKKYIQAGSFRQKTEAKKMMDRLAVLNIQSFIENKRVGDTHWNRVLFGPYVSSLNIQSLRKKLKQHGIDTIVFIKSAD
mgnify:CR=1 FL=1